METKRTPGQPAKAERQFPGSLYVQSTGRQKCAPLRSWGPEAWKHYLLCHVVNGRGSYFCGGVTYELCPGDSFLVYPDTVVSCCADEKDPWTCFWVCFSGTEADYCVGLTDFTPERPVLQGRLGYLVKKHLQEIQDAWGPGTAEALAMAGGLCRLLSVLMHKPKQETSNHIPEAVHRAVEYIGEHYAEPLSAEQLAELTSMSYSSLYRCFMRSFGMSPKRYLLEYRLEKARKLLEGTGLSVGEVGLSVGFEDPLYFSRVFRNSTGMSPRQYAAEQKK